MEAHWNVYVSYCGGRAPNDKEVLQTFSHHSPYPRKRFNRFDSVPLATLRFKLSKYQEKK